MGKSLGTIEVVGLSSAIVIADTMAKTANIDINDLEITKGFGFVTVKIFGDVGAVKAAISAGKTMAIQSGSYVASNVIARPNQEIEKKILSFRDKKDNKVEKDNNKSTIKEDKKEKDSETVNNLDNKKDIELDNKEELEKNIDNSKETIEESKKEEKIIVEENKIKLEENKSDKEAYKESVIENKSSEKKEETKTSTSKNKKKKNNKSDKVTKESNKDNK
ncbi:BMC domain-containing protein [Peptacetobacter sp.]|uniref:BMC domain-containing protein n=1 Tax=Peptacetobacter sp. TaxID=2991975 RepID=UPI002631EDE5|nr:BMC domain-containing protein [Peptacetobacter sp.]